MHIQCEHQTENCNSLVNEHDVSQTWYAFCVVMQFANGLQHCGRVEVSGGPALVKKGFK